MTLTVTIDLPPEVEKALESTPAATSKTAREALAVSLFREGRLSHAELARALSLDRFETDALLKRHNVTMASPSLADLNADRSTLEKVLGPVRR